MSVDELIEKLNNIRLIDEAADGVREVKDQIIYLNQQQLLAGKRSDDTSLGTYRPFTITKRQEKGRQTAHVDLFFEGDFQGAMDIEVEGDRFNIYSKDSKSDKLQDVYGDAIFGLNNENRLKAWNEFIRGIVVRNVASKYDFAIVTR